MADNQPPSSQRHDLLGLPLWAWGLGLGAFLVAIILFFRQQNQGGSATTTGQTGYGVPYPYPVPANANTSGQATQSQQFAYVTGSGNPGLAAYGNNVPVYAGPNDTSVLGELPSGVGFNPSGSPIKEFSTLWGSPGFTYYALPVNEPGGVTGYLHSTDVTPSMQQVNAVQTSQTPMGIYGYPSSYLNA